MVPDDGPCGHGKDRPCPGAPRHDPHEHAGRTEAKDAVDRPRRPGPALATEHSAPDGHAGTGGWKKHMRNGGTGSVAPLTPRLRAAGGENGVLAGQSTSGGTVRGGLAVSGHRCAPRPSSGAPYLTPPSDLLTFPPQTSRLAKNPLSPLPFRP
ncbi:hypothetical protein GCM10022630_16460 [Thermobifida alba]